MYHSFDVDIAKEYGILEAVLINNLDYWITKNEANEVNFFDGYYWTYNSTRAFSELFPYASERQIKAALKSLRDKGIIQTGNYNKVPYDRTLWYAFTDFGLSIVRNGTMDRTDRDNGKYENVQPIPDINTDDKQDKKPNNKAVERMTFGEYQNVLLSTDELNKLRELFPDDWEDRIENLSEYMASKGKTYKNHLATIRNWARRNGERRQQPTKNDYTGDGNTGWACFDDMM